MKRRLSTSIGVIILIAVICLSVIVPTFAWFFDELNVPMSITAHVHQNYFNGQGTEEDPYEIEYPVQLFYFAWLQDLGRFNEENEETGEVEPVYFKVVKDLDMTGYILPTIGTTTYPFIGYFDGNDKVISNLTVSNVDASVNPDLAADGVKDIPEGEETGTQAQIMGFFGVVGDYPVNANAISWVPEIKDFALQNLNIKIKTPLDDKSLFGIVAGYVHGNISKVLLADVGF